MIFRLRRFSEIYQRLVDYVVSRSTLTDVTPGSNLAQILGAFARGIETAYFEIGRLLELFSIDRARGPDLDARAADYPESITRLSASRATGALRWTRDIPAVSEIIIPVGTKVARPASSPLVEYVTTATGHIAIGATQSERTDGPAGDIPARAIRLGAEGNAAIDSVTLQTSIIAGATGVTNPTPFTGGVDIEGDDSFRARIIAHVQSLSRCTPQALESRALEADLDGHRLRIAKIIQRPSDVGRATLYVDDGTGSTESYETVAAGEDLIALATGGETRFTTDRWPLRSDTLAITLYRLVPPDLVLVQGTDFDLEPAWGLVVLSSSVFPLGLTAGDRLEIKSDYEVYTGLVEEAQRLIDGDPADPATYPCWRAAGTVIRVKPPRVRWILAQGSIVVLDGYDRETVAANVRAAVAESLNGLSIADDVIRAELIQVAMGVDGMYDIILTTPAANIPIADDEVARTLITDLEIY